MPKNSSTKRPQWLSYFLGRHETMNDDEHGGSVYVDGLPWIFFVWLRGPELLWRKTAGQVQGFQRNYEVNRVFMNYIIYQGYSYPFKNMEQSAFQELPQASQEKTHSTEQACQATHASWHRHLYSPIAPIRIGTLPSTRKAWSHSTAAAGRLRGIRKGKTRDKCFKSAM